MEAGSASRTDAADVKAGLATKGAFPETLANGFSIEAGMAFKLDAAAANDGLGTEAASVTPGFRFSELVAASGLCAVFGTTFPSANVV